MAEKVLWSVEHLNLRMGDRILFRDASLSIGEGERVALVGRNGCGKSTLMRVLAGLEEPSSGTVSRARGLRIAFMPQENQEPLLLTEKGTVRELVREGLSFFEGLLQRYESLPAASPEHEALEHLLTHHDAWNPENKLDVILDRLGLPADRAPSSLSGGELRRTLLARAVIAEPDLLLLDEPTNHLDIYTAQWIEEFLSEYRGACFFVTHDRCFLDRIATRIVGIDGAGGLYSVIGSYADFLEEEAERHHSEDRLEEKRRAFLRRELDWVRRSPKARLRRNLVRIRRYREIEARSAPERPGEMELILPPPPRLGNRVVDLKNVSLSLGGRRLFSDFSFEFTADLKVGIVGANGSGKSSLLKLITRELSPDEGTVAVADTVQFNYVDQSRTTLNPENTLCGEAGGGLDFVRVGEERVSIRSYLRRFLFEEERMNVRVKTLSGGEKARLALAKILKDGGNFLILDEPTNDLDLSTLRVLEESLRTYPSALVVVSHDRYFLNRVCNCIIAFEAESETLSISLGDYDTYLEKKNRRRSSSPGASVPGGTKLFRSSSFSSSFPSPAAAKESGGKLPDLQKEEGEGEGCPAGSTRRIGTMPDGKKKKTKLSYLEERELNELEGGLIAAAEQKVSDCEAAFSDPSLFSSRPKEVPVVQAALAAARAELERLYARWEELENRKESLKRPQE